MVDLAGLDRLLELPFGATFEGVSTWTEELGRWLLAHPVPDGTRTRALQALNEGLERHPRSEELAGLLREFAAHGRAVRLFAEAGLPDHPSFAREAFRRLVDKVVPRLDPADDLYAWLDRLAPGLEDAAWAARLPEALIAPWRKHFEPALEARGEAARLLAHRSAALALSRELLNLQRLPRDLDSPFAELPRVVGELLEGRLELDLLDDLLGRCREVLAQAHEHLEGSGVSTALVFHLDLLEAELGRIRHLVEPGGDAAPLAVELIEGIASRHHLKPLLKTGLRRLARKVVEHTGAAGEHYLARSPEELRQMGRAAAGGGALTALTAALKVAIAHLALAPGLVGIGLAVNYAGSFILMHFLHLILASKQPAATAATLAAVLESPDEGDEIELVAAASRGQAAATLGNILLAIPAALAFNALWRLLSGHAFVGSAKAALLLGELHPFRSWTILFAAFTGVLLWMGSLAGGWASNWSAYRDLPEAVAHSPRLRRLLGRGGARRFGDWIGRHFASLVNCTALGILLGFLPVLLAFTGIPLEVRHVTLSAASAALALGPGLASGQVPWAAAAWALLGVAFIGLMNFGVSFALSLRLALRARGLAGSGRALSGRIWRAFWARPSRFLWRGEVQP